MSSLELTIYLLAAIAYFIPFYIARYRRINGQHLIFWFNLLFAWTFVAWVVLIVVAFSLKAEDNNSHSLST